MKEKNIYTRVSVIVSPSRESDHAFKYSTMHQFFCLFFFVMQMRNMGVLGCGSKKSYRGEYRLILMPLNRKVVTLITTVTDGVKAVTVTTHTWPRDGKHLGGPDDISLPGIERVRVTGPFDKIFLASRTSARLQDRFNIVMGRGLYHLQLLFIKWSLQDLRPKSTTV